MARDDLVQSRSSLAAGVGVTSRRDKVLPAPIAISQIPARIGFFQQREPEVNITPPACLGSNWWTYDSSYPWYARAWHTDLDTLVSSDGVMRLDRQAHKRISFQGTKPSLSTTPIHVCFASPTVAAVPEPGAALSDWHMVETVYGNREWHPLQTVMVFPLGLIGAAQRLKSIELQQHGTGYKFRWRFKTPADATLTGTTPTCLNRTGDETRTADRVFNNNGTAQPRRRLTKFALVTADGKKGEVEQRSAPWGFLPATSFVHVALLEMNIASSESNQLNMTDLSRILSVGQPYHGVCTPTGIETLAGSPLPKPASPTSYSAPQNQNTRYFKHPSPPGVPASNLLPPDYASAGYEFRDDVIFCGGQQYGPVGTWMLPTASSWLHVDSAGICRVLGLVLVSDTASTTTWDVVRYDHPAGPQQFAYTVIGQIAITTTDATLVAAVPSEFVVRTYTGSTDLQVVEGVSGKPLLVPSRESTFNLWSNRVWAVESSPDGRKIAVTRGIFNPMQNIGTGRQGHCLATIATFEIDGSYGISGPTYEWQYAHTYSEQSDYTVQYCMGFAFKADGTLFKWITEESWQSLGQHDIGSGLQWYHDISACTYNATQVDVYVPPPNPDPGGPGVTFWNNRSTAFWPYWIWSHRLSNNVLIQRVYFLNYEGDAEGLMELSTPSGAVDYYATMPAGVATNGRAVSWNPKTGEIAARTNSGRISWI